MEKTTTPENMATQERSHRPWAKRTLRWKGNLIFSILMMPVGAERQIGREAKAPGEVESMKEKRLSETGR